VVRVSQWRALFRARGIRSGPRRSSRVTGFGSSTVPRRAQRRSG